MNAVFKVSIMVLLIAFSVSLSSYGAEWSVVWNGTDGKSRNLSMSDDQEYPFTMGRFKCKSSKVILDKIYGEVFERRIISCQVSKDTYVSTDLSYNIKSKICMDTRSLTIFDKDKIYLASLFVNCN